MNILGLIPARGGSKGIFRKNLIQIKGKSLLYYAIEAGMGSKYIDKLVVSTEDEEIKKSSAKLKCDVIDRPKALATDDASTLDVVKNTLEYLKQNESYIPEYFVLIQPTAPLRNSGHIDDCIEIIQNKNCDSVVSIAKVPSHYHPDWQLKINGEDCLVDFKDNNISKLKHQRQKLAKTYFRNGAIYTSSPRTIQQYGNMYGVRCIPYVMPTEISVNIDSHADLSIAEYYLNHQK